MTTGEAARALRCCVNTVRNLVRRGRLVAPRNRRGARVFDAGDVQALARRRSWIPTRHCCLCGASTLADGHRMKGRRAYCDRGGCRRRRAMIRWRRWTIAHRKVAA